MGNIGLFPVNGHVTDRGLLRAALTLALALFGLFLVWRFLAGIATAVLVLLVGLLLAVALSGPVEALHRRKIPRVVASVAIIVSILVVFGLGCYLFVPVLPNKSGNLFLPSPSPSPNWARGRRGSETGPGYHSGTGRAPRSPRWPPGDAESWAGRSDFSGA